MLRNPPENKDTPDKRKGSPEINYRNVLESMDEGFASCRMIYDNTGKAIDFRYLYINAAFTKLTGLSPESVIGRTVKEVLPNIEPFCIEAYERVVRSGKSEHFENKVDSIRKQFKIKAWPSSDGCFNVIFEDITRKKEEEKNMSLQAAALEAAANGIVISDIKGEIQWVNSAFTKLTGYKFEEVVGKSTNILNSGKHDKSFYKNIWNSLLSGKLWYGEIINRKKDGTLYIEEQTITPVKDEAGKITQFIAIKQNVSSRKKLEVDLQSKNAELRKKGKLQEDTKQAMLNIMDDLDAARSIIEIEKIKDEAMLASIGEGLIAVDNEAKITVINKAAEGMLGWKEKELIGRDLSYIPMEDEDGHLLPNNKLPTYISLSTGKMTNNNFSFIRRDKTKFPTAINVTPIKIGGKITGAINIFRDITREKEIDRAKSEFVSLASHQLRTPLGIAKWYLEALIGEDYFVRAPEVIREYINEVYKSNERVLALVRDLLSVSRIDQEKVKDSPKRTSITQLVETVIKEMRIMANKNKINIHLNLKKSEIQDISIDPLRFQEIIENLVSNAIVYSNTNGIIEIIIDTINDKLIIEVKDKGIGISREDQKKLFTKFYRSEKAMSKNTEGSGLGLYVVKSYVDGWGGNISISSEEGKGSIFTLSLPMIIPKNKPVLR